MPKVTSKYQVTVPKAIADKYGIRPGDRIDWIPSGDGIRVIPAARATSGLDVQARLHMFDAATARQRKRGARRKPARENDRGWRREDVYTRGNSR